MDTNYINSLSASEQERLLSMLENQINRSKIISRKTNAELAQILVDLTEHLDFESFQYILYMEVAERLAPELFDAAEREVDEKLKPLQKSEKMLKREED